MTTPWISFKYPIIRRTDLNKRQDESVSKDKNTPEKDANEFDSGTSSKEPTNQSESVNPFTKDRRGPNPNHPSEDPDKTDLNGRLPHRTSKPSKENDALIAEKFMQLYDLLDESQKMEVLSGLDSSKESGDGEWLDTDFYPGYEGRSGHDDETRDLEEAGDPDDLTSDDDEDLDSNKRKLARSGDPRKREKARHARGRSKDGERFESGYEFEEDVEDGRDHYDEIDNDNEEAWSTFDEMDDDAVLADNGDSGAVRLTDSIITYETDRYINPKTDRPYSRMRLRSQPPVLKFRQHKAGTSEDEDESVDIIVTRPLAMQLSNLMGDIVKAYDGVPVEDKKREPFSFKHLRKSIADTWRYEPAKVIIVVLITIIAVVFGVYGIVQGL